MLQVLQNLTSELGDEKQCITFKQLVQALEGTDGDEDDGDFSATVGDTTRFATMRKSPGTGHEAASAEQVGGDSYGMDDTAAPSAATALPADGVKDDTLTRTAFERLGAQHTQPSAAPQQTMFTFDPRKSAKGGTKWRQEDSGSHSSDELGAGDARQRELSLELSLSSVPSRGPTQSPRASLRVGPDAPQRSGMRPFQNPAFAATEAMDNAAFSADLPQGSHAAQRESQRRRGGPVAEGSGAAEADESYSQLPASTAQRGATSQAPLPTLRSPRHGVGFAGADDGERDAVPAAPESLSATAARSSRLQSGSPLQRRSVAKSARIGAYAAQDDAAVDMSGLSESGSPKGKKHKRKASFASMVETSTKSMSGTLVARSGKSISAAAMRKAFQSLGSDPEDKELQLEDVVLALRNKTPPNQLLQVLPLCCA